VKDGLFVLQIKQVMKENPSYGSPRLSMALKANHKRIERVMQKFKLKAIRRRRKHFKPSDQKQEPSKNPNLLKNLCVITPRYAYATDFTYINHQGSFLYLATVIDLATREIVGSDISNRHTADMMQRAMAKAFLKGIPEILHSDQGSEMKSDLYTNFAQGQGVKISMSSKASPWQNGFQESFYNGFKLDLGDVNRFAERGELIEAIIQNIYYYNTKRIHTAFKMTPQERFQSIQAKFELLKLG